MNLKLHFIVGFVSNLFWGFFTFSSIVPAFPLKFLSLCVFAGFTSCVRQSCDFCDSLPHHDVFHLCSTIPTSLEYLLSVLPSLLCWFLCFFVPVCSRSVSALIPHVALAWLGSFVPFVATCLRLSFGSSGFFIPTFLPPFEYKY